MQKEAEKTLKHMRLCTETQHMWNMKCIIIPIIIGAIGIVTKGLKKIWKPYEKSIQQIQYKRQLY
jgi:hypothetical protein